MFFSDDGVRQVNVHLTCEAFGIGARRINESLEAFFGVLGVEELVFGREKVLGGHGQVLIHGVDAIGGIHGRGRAYEDFEVGDVVGVNGVGVTNVIVAYKLVGFPGGEGGFGEWFSPIVVGGAGGVYAVVFVGKHNEDFSQLLEVVCAAHSPGLLAGAGQGGQQYGGEYGDDGNDHHEFNEGEPFYGARVIHGRDVSLLPI